MRSDPPGLRLNSVSHERLRQQFCIAIHGGVNRAARCRTWKSIINSFAASRGRFRVEPDHTRRAMLLLITAVKKTSRCVNLWSPKR